MTNIINGTASNDTLSGTVGDDEINGLAGDDILNGVNNPNPSNRFFAGVTVYDTLNGGDGNDILNGGNFVNTTFIGGNGDDTLNGGLNINFPRTINTASYATATLAVTVDLSITTAQNTVGAGIDTLTNMTSLVGSDFNDNLTGGSVFGGLGNDTIRGTNGNDYLDGGAGIDGMDGGAGDDYYVVDNVLDAVLDNAGVDTVSFEATSGTYTLAANIENLYLDISGNHNVNGIGNNLDNIITGNIGNNQLNGGLGNDTLEGGNGTDTAIFNINYQNVSSVRHLKTGGWVLSSADGTDMLTSIENLSFLNGNFTSDVNGDAIDQLLNALPLAQYISAINGVDTNINASLYSGPVSFLEYQFLGDNNSNVIQAASTNNDFISLAGGNDAANASLGDDVIDGGTGSNFLTGGGGHDTFFLDGRGGTTTWSTITDFHHLQDNYFVENDEVNIWGWIDGTSQLMLAQENGGAAGYTGATFHYDLNGDNTIDTSVTFTGLLTWEVPASAVHNVAGTGLLLIA